MTLEGEPKSLDTALRAEDDERVTDEEREKRNQFLDVMEQRRHHADAFAWAVPPIIVATQAITLGVVFADETENWQRAVAAIASLLITTGLAHHYYKQRFHFAMYEAVIRRERTALYLPLVDRDSLLALAPTLERRFQDRWMRKGADKALVADTKLDSYRPNWLIERRAANWWQWIFAAFILLDAVLTIWALWQWGSPDPEPRFRFRFDR